MAGNVWEWVGDWYGAYSEGEQMNPTGVETGDTRVLRGSAWIGKAHIVRSALRNRSNPRYRSAGIGIRCVRSSTSVSP